MSMPSGRPLLVTSFGAALIKGLAQLVFVTGFAVTGFGASLTSLDVNVHAK